MFFARFCLSPETLELLKIAQGPYEMGKVINHKPFKGRRTEALGTLLGFMASVWLDVTPEVSSRC